MGSFYSKRRNQKFSSFCIRVLNVFEQKRFLVSHILMISVSIGRFHQQIIGLCNQSGVLRDRNIPLSYISGKNDFCFFSSFRDEYFDRSRTKDMTSILISYRNRIVDHDHLGILHRFKKRHASISFFRSIQGSSRR